MHRSGNLSAAEAEPEPGAFDLPVSIYLLVVQSHSKLRVHPVPFSATLPHNALGVRTWVLEVSLLLFRSVSELDSCGAIPLLRPALPGTVGN